MVVPKEEPIGQEPGSSRGSFDPSGSPPGDAGGSAFNLSVTLKARLEIKRHLLLERKVMTNLDSIFKSRDITLPTKVHLWLFLWSCMDVRVGL